MFKFQHINSNKIKKQKVAIKKILQKFTWKC